MENMIPMEAEQYLVVDWRYFNGGPGNLGNGGGFGKCREKAGHQIIACTFKGIR